MRQQSTHGLQPSEKPSAPLTRAALLERAMHQPLSGTALVLTCKVSRDRSGRPYLQLVLGGGDGGQIAARWWRYPYPIERLPPVGHVCWFTGTVDEYDGARQLRITDGRPAPDVDRSLFVRTARRPLSELQAELEQHIGGLDAEIERLVRATLSGETYERFCHWPAAQRRHGAVRHGLLAHSCRVADLALRDADAYMSVGLSYDRGLVVAGCLLHDVGKIDTLPEIAGASLPARAQRLDHISRGLLLVRQAADRLEQEGTAVAGDRLDALFHIILAHHGHREWGAPVEPQTIEAWLVHLADLAEASLWRWSGEELS